MSAASSAPRTKPGASSRTRSQRMAMSGPSLRTGGQHSHPVAGPIGNVEQLAAERNEAQSHAALHGSERRTGACRDLALSQAVEIGELDRFALGRRQSLECDPDLLGVEPAGNLRPDVEQR